MKDKRPSFQFYPGDWMKDPALREVSLGARGLWMDMLCMMFEGERRGYLQRGNGNPVSVDGLARMAGGSLEEVKLYLEELEECGVLSREDGVIFSRRMVRDEEERKRQIEVGRKGGSPAFSKGKRNPYYHEKDKGGVMSKDNPPVILKDKGGHNPKITPSSSSASSSSASSSNQNQNLSPKNPALVDKSQKERKNEAKSEKRQFWSQYIAGFCQRIAREKGLARPYQPTGKEIRALASLYDQFTPEVVLACWDMAWERERPWSGWGAQNGRSIEWFCQPRTILAIMDDSRYKAKAERFRREFGTSANGVLRELEDMVKLEVR